MASSTTYRPAPYHPASNGLAERAIQIVKKGLKKVLHRAASNGLAKRAIQIVKMG